MSVKSDATKPVTKKEANLVGQSIDYDALKHVEITFPALVPLQN